MYESLEEEKERGWRGGDGGNNVFSVVFFFSRILVSVSVRVENVCMYVCMYVWLLVPSFGRLADTIQQ